MKPSSVSPPRRSGCAPPACHRRGGNVSTGWLKSSSPSLLGAALAALLAGQCLAALAPVPQAGAAEDDYFILSRKGSAKQDLAGPFAYIMNSEYEVHRSPGGGAYVSANRKQGLRFTYLPNGFTAQPLESATGSDSWRVTLRLRSWGPEDAVSEPTRAVADAKGHAIRFTTGEVIYDYTNGPAGMRQNFTIQRKPTRGSLTLELAADLRGVRMGLDAGGGAVQFSDSKTGHTVMRYSDLRVCDASGRRLPAKMALLGADRLVLSIDDASAQYPVVVDPLSSSGNVNGSQLSGASVGQKFGFSVAAGNADTHFSNGFVLVGAPSWNDGTSAKGKVFVFQQTSSGGINSTPDWTAQGTVTGGQFGYSVAVGDDDHTFNNDILGDIAVGCPQGGSSGYGQVLVWYGGSGGFNTNPDRTLNPPDYGQMYFGFSVGTVRRANADGSGYAFNTLVVGAPYFYGSYNNQGKAYAYYGSTSGLPTSPSWYVNGQAQGWLLGWSVGGASYMDGNTYGDALIGAPGASIYELGSGGAVFVYAGSSSGLATSASLTVAGAQSGMQFGYSVTGIPFFYYSNNNPYGAFAVGAPGYTVSGKVTGQVFVYDTLTTTTPVAQVGPMSSANGSCQFGYAVAGGDVNNDTYGALIVGAPYQQGFNSNDQAGWIYVFYNNGQQGFSSSVDATTTYNAGSHFGRSVAFMNYLPNPSGPGTGVLIGAPDDKDGGSSAYGSVWSEYYHNP